ncbi:hypothetical protein PsorP6_001401 [Peronosclerospora sorghi]|uniref:Uncharacterized protein n=1 Tax=Peronosclerospora sorghi TaxID=230839 RepID=A0ACC0WZ52_9STRA|nr:hypothetical protein PsorP6_001401 [Peronosclerospora sorghi]
MRRRIVVVVGGDDAEGPRSVRFGIATPLERAVHQPAGSPSLPSTVAEVMTVLVSPATITLVVDLLQTAPQYYVKIRVESSIVDTNTATIFSCQDTAECCWNCDVAKSSNMFDETLKNYGPFGQDLTINYLRGEVVIGRSGMYWAGTYRAHHDVPDINCERGAQMLCLQHLF